METIEHFAKISLVARMLGGERLISQDEVMRLQGLRGMYGIAAPAPICLDDQAADRCRRVLPGGRAPDVPGRAARARGSRRDGDVGTDTRTAAR